jgi:hypothetical protein
MAYICQEQGYLIGEAPIIFANRERGASKISKSEIVKAVYTVARLKLGAKRIAHRNNKEKRHLER